MAGMNTNFEVELYISIRRVSVKTASTRDDTVSRVRIVHRHQSRQMLAITLQKIMCAVLSINHMPSMCITQYTYIFALLMHIGTHL